MRSLGDKKVKNKYINLGIVMLMLAGAVLAQRPPQGPPRNGPPPMGDNGPNRPGAPPPGDWIKPHDTNQNGILEADEFHAAVDKTFAELDKNGNGVLEPSEIGRPPRHNNSGNPNSPPDGQRERPLAPHGPPNGPQNGPGKPILPPFFFQDQIHEGATVTRAEFDAIVNRVFAEMDKNGDGAISHDEAKQVPMREGASGPPHEGPPPPPNAQFIGAELRFGDKLVTGQPFAAATVIEDTRRLYDGTTVTKQSKGLIYRDTAGRTRREQPLDNVGGFNIVGDNAKAQMLVFINDFGVKSQYFLDVNNKVARKNHIGDNRGPMPDKDGPPDAKTESLGTRTIEGVSAEGTRSTFEIPAGQIGNAKPIQVVSEKWFSPELQVVVMSRHMDPLAGEHVFKLVNIKRGEPSADLFTIPSGYRIENGPERGRIKE